MTARLVAPEVSRHPNPCRQPSTSTRLLSNTLAARPRATFGGLQEAMRGAHGQACVGIAAIKCGAGGSFTSSCESARRRCALHSMCQFAGIWSLRYLASQCAAAKRQSPQECSQAVCGPAWPLHCASHGLLPLASAPGVIDLCATIASSAIGRQACYAHKLSAQQQWHIMVCKYCSLAGRFRHGALPPAPLELNSNCRWGLTGPQTHVNTKQERQGASRKTFLSQIASQ